MSAYKANVVIAGDAIYAGIDEHDAAEIPTSILIQFPTQEALGQALRSGHVEFTVFESPEWADAGDE